MATARTNGFRWLPSYYEAIRDLPDAERLQMYDAIADFGFGNSVEELPPLLNGYFGLIKPSLEKSMKFEAKQKANGEKGGRPPKPNNNPEETQNCFGFLKEGDAPKPNGNLAVAVDSAVDSANNFDIEKRGASKPPRTRFVPPTLEEVTAYCQQRKNTVDPQRFMDYYEANGWVQGKGKPIRDWQAAVRTWETGSQQRRQPAQQQSDLSWRNSRPPTLDDMVEYPEGSGQYHPRWEVTDDA